MQKSLKVLLKMQNGTNQEFKVISFRKTVVPSDKLNVTNILKSTGFFKPYEIEVAIELIEENLRSGEGSGYRFNFIEIEGKTVGYCCYGEIPVTVKNFDLYWIAVDNNYRGKGLGRLLMDKTEADIRVLGGRGIYIETSNKEQYKPTMDFYSGCGYKQVALFEDFYDINDNKAVYFKKL
jgi:ribosomal protein S18 acetylase RimI-like enzyme